MFATATSRLAQVARLLGLAAFLSAAAGSAAAQAPVKARIWEVQMGTPVTALPAHYFDPHCGTDGGPPSIRLSGWADFTVCPVEEATGLREVWFTEDDEAEYVARAYRGQLLDEGPVAANIWLNHRVIYSVLVDEAGLVQGYRVITDPREPETLRYDAQLVANYLVTFYGYSSFVCVDLDPLPGETDVDGIFVKRDCAATIDGLRITIERRFLRKPGQFALDPVTQLPTTNYFESRTRLQVVAADRVRP